MNKKAAEGASGVKPAQPVNPWGSALDKLQEWDPKGAELLLRVGMNPWSSGVLPRKEVELISLALYCACTSLHEAGTRRHIRAALDAGATRDEVLLVFKCGAAMAVHSCSLGAPILLEEMKTAGVKAAGGPKPATPACDAMREIGQWNTAWDPFYELSPLWTDDFFAFGASIYKSGTFTPRFMELGEEKGTGYFSGYQALKYWRLWPNRRLRHGWLNSKDPNKGTSSFRGKG